LKGALEQVLTSRAETGAVLNRLETTENYWTNFKLNLTESLSATEDADLTKTITDLTAQESAYQASLAASARVLQMSLLDFLQ
jgi:flagellar hook-associated protein 3 FlgL